MSQVIVSIIVSHKGRETSYDMEIPCQVPAGKLAGQIADTLNQYIGEKRFPTGSRLNLYCVRLSRNLAPTETFLEAGIWNGDRIKLQ